MSGYARALSRSAIPALPMSRVELRLTHRMQRQRVLERNAPALHTGYVHELALRLQFGGRSATREPSEGLPADCPSRRERGGADQLSVYSRA
ncbi:Scr1 family TA system antitoxin-like transcriptional regulator [Streptomyces sp. NPDC096339]|uniref:Scr1 family TA system antitoxin-like transcriptional regulator n=1 Tax=Streptomyces sp. NPDC096339 TaxID=3366086 RepID=UPI0038090B9A